MNLTADEFCEVLRARVTLRSHDRPDLGELAPPYRCDELFLLAADFSDSLTEYRQGVVGDGVVLEGALAVAAAACQVYLATVGRPHGEETDDGNG